MNPLEKYFPFRIPANHFHLVSKEPHILKKFQKHAFHESNLAILFTTKIWKLADFEMEFPELDCEEIQLKKKYILVKNVPSNYPKMLHLMEIYKNSGLEMYIFLANHLNLRWEEEVVTTTLLMRKKTKQQLWIDIAEDELLLFFDEMGSKTHAVGFGEQWGRRLSSFT
ncbi:hypothetical protein [Listeria booriae]|uniref:hypothetical protein n=1 Tax=Listeria booriae TaxID=1552123 RepID=UPI0016273C2A|nr:hypothetical protein [Listeria booriae]MBC2258477.1 hypothetical protein [Listeria booriae]